VGELTEYPGVELIIAVDHRNELLGGVVYYRDVKYYGAMDGVKVLENTAGFRFLAVEPIARGMGIGRKLTLTCIDRAKKHKKSRLIIHTTKAMQLAWNMYVKLGFFRQQELDFKVKNLQVYGLGLLVERKS